MYKTSWRKHGSKQTILVEMLPRTSAKKLYITLFICLILYCFVLFYLNFSGTIHLKYDIKRMNMELQENKVITNPSDKIDEILQGDDINDVFDDYDEDDDGDDSDDHKKVFANSFKFIDHKNIIKKKMDDLILQRKYKKIDGEEFNGDIDENYDNDVDMMSDHIEYQIEQDERKQKQELEQEEKEKQQKQQKQQQQQQQRQQQQQQQQKKTQQQLQQCVIPELNPFHPDVQPYLKYLGKEKCSIQRLAYIQQNKLVLNVKKVQDAYLRYIRRDTDFLNTFSSEEDLIKRSLLRQGRRGCLEVAAMRSVLTLETKQGIEYDGKNTNEPVKLVADGLQRMKKCSSFAKFNLTKEGRIIHQKSARCWMPEVPQPNSIIMLSTPSECEVKKTEFLITENKKIIKHAQTGYCVNINFMTHELYLDTCSNVRFGFAIHRSKGRDINMKIDLKEEFIELNLRINHQWHKEYHAVINKPTTQSVDNSAPADGKTSFNILMLMVDSISNANFQRQMNKTFKYLDEDSDTVTMKGHTIVGDGTTAQLTAMLTGLPEYELPEARRNFNNSQYVDVWPFIFKDYQQKGYSTLFSEDDPVVNTFNFRLKGFDEPPTTHYLRPLWIEMEKIMKGSEFSCPQKFLFDYLKQFYESLKTQKKFSYTILSRLAHDNMNRLGYADNDIIDLFHFLENNGHRNNTVVILFGDHGARASDFRRTIQGKLEERLPFMSISLPKTFKTNHPIEFTNLKSNSQILTAHYDIYETLKHLLNLAEKPKQNTKFGKSLFTNITMLNRSCASAGVDQHWCPCLDYEQIETNNHLVKDISQKAVGYINQIIEQVPKAKQKCHHLSLKNILRASKQTTNSQIQKFNGTSENSQCDSCGVNLLQDSKVQSTYELVFSTHPSNAEYEINADVIEFRNKTYTIRILPGISRINLYGNQPECIASEYPHLRKYCYCK